MTAAAPTESVVQHASPCMLCGNANWQRHLHDIVDYLTGEKFDIDLCPTCQLMVTRPMPHGDQIDRYYPPRYRGNRHGFTGRMRVALRCRAIESWFDRGFHGRLLDVGCGDGAFVLEMRRRGWDVCATEIDPATVERLRAAGIDAKLPADAEREGFDQPVDAATCWHVMEHVSDPAHVANWVRQQLKPRGIFQATVPNAAAFQARVFGRQWIHYDVPRHLYHFSPQAFRALMLRAGYTISGQTNFAMEYDWFGIIQSALNLVCHRKNLLFEKLTSPPMDRRERGAITARDKLLTGVLTGPVAALSLPPMLVGWAFGEGATLTLTCRA